MPSLWQICNTSIAKCRVTVTRPFKLPTLNKLIQSKTNSAAVRYPTIA